MLVAGRATAGFVFVVLFVVLVVNAVVVVVCRNAIVTPSQASPETSS